MKDNKNIVLTLGSSIILFLLLIIIENYLLQLLNINLAALSNTTNLILNIVYVIISFLITVIFYLKLKKVSDTKAYIKTFFSGVGAVLAYFILNELQTLPLLLAGINIETMPLIAKIIYMLAYEVLIILVVYYILKDKIDKAIADIKINHKQYFSKYFKFWLIAIVIMSTSNIIIGFINGGEIAGNEEAVRNTFAQAPVYMFIASVFLAPVLEEFVFRQGIRNIFSNDKLFIIMSGLIFGGLHVVGTINNWTDLLYLIPYCTPGFIFAYILSKTDNIFVSTGLHFFHNGILMSLQVLLLILGQLLA